MNPNTQQQTAKPTKSKGILALFLSLFSLLISGITSLFTRDPNITVNGAKVESEVAKTAGSAFIGILTMPLTLFAIAFAFIVIIVVIARFHRSSPLGVVMRCIALALSSWALWLAVSTFQYFANL